jgi:uncharacterized protein (DUF1778 family)
MQCDIGYTRVMPAAKRKPNRSTSAAFLVRCSEEEAELIARAVAKVQADLPHGARLSQNAFCLAAAVAKAREVLGERGR